MKRETKTELLTIRCTVKEKDHIRNKAKEKNINLGTYILDSAIAGLERKNYKEKKRLKRKVEMQELLNEISRKLQEDDISKGELISLLQDIIEEEKKEWQN